MGRGKLEAILPPTIGDSRLLPAPSRVSKPSQCRTAMLHPHGDRGKMGTRPPTAKADDRFQ